MKGTAWRPRLPPRRSLLAVLGILALLAAGTGGYLLLTDDGAGPTDRVPQRADAVAHVDVASATATDTGRELALRAFAVQDGHAFYRGPRLGRWLGTFAGSEHVALRDADSLTAFVALDGNATRVGDYGAVVVEAEWTERSLVRAIEADANVTLERREGGARPRYAPVTGPGPQVAVLENGTYAVGDRAAVADAVAVATGEEPPVAGPLRERFRSTRPGFATVAYPFPHDVVPELPSVVGRGFAHTGLVTGVYYANGTANGTRYGAEFGLHTNESDAAENHQATVGLGLQFYAANTDDPVVRRAAHRVRIDRRGHTVHLRYEAPPDAVRALLERLDR